MPGPWRRRCHVPDRVLAAAESGVALPVHGDGRLVVRTLRVPWRQKQECLQCPREALVTSAERRGVVSCPAEGGYEAGQAGDTGRLGG